MAKHHIKILLYSSLMSAASYASSSSTAPCHHFAALRAPPRSSGPAPLRSARRAAPARPRSSTALLRSDPTPLLRHTAPLRPEASSDRQPAPRRRLGDGRAALRRGGGRPETTRKSPPRSSCLSRHTPLVLAIQPLVWYIWVKEREI